MSALETLNASTNAMLESLGQGLLFFDAKGICGAIYSKSCVDLLECDPAHKDIADVLKLSPESRSLLQTVLEMLFTGKMVMGFDELASLAPAKYMHSGGLHVSLSYRPIYGPDGLLKNVLVVATDRTKETKAEKRLKEIEVAALRTIRISRSRNYFMHFIRNFESCIAMPRAGTQSAEQMHRDIHTLKGMATMFQFVDLAHTLHRLEAEIPKKTTDLEPVIAKHREKLMDQFEDSKVYAREVLGDDFLKAGHIRSIPEERLYAFAKQIKNSGVAFQPLYSAYCQNVLAVPLWHMLDDFTLTVQELADRIGKPIHPCVFAGENFPVLPEVYGPLFASFVHIARNIVDHGIESAKLRTEHGKASKATIAIHTDIYKKGSDEWFYIEFKDDGGGIDVASLRKKLAENAAESDLGNTDDHILIQTLFDAKVSTRKHATIYSGRGIGLNAVKAEAVKLGGSVMIFSEPAVGVRLRIDLPYTRFI
jgi:HPt (histidine-containing phosphotransfer) domain-containing protein